MPNIDIDQSLVSNYSSDINSAASNIKVGTLSAIDCVSTIVGNELCREAFADAQSTINSLVAAIDIEAKKIQSLGDEFSAVDEQLASMFSSLSGK